MRSVKAMENLLLKVAENFVIDFPYGVLCMLTVFSNCLFVNVPYCYSHVVTLAVLLTCLVMFILDELPAVHV